MAKVIESSPFDQERLAAVAGVNRSTVFRVSRPGVHGIFKKNFEAIAMAMGMTFEQLRGQVGAPADIQPVDDDAQPFAHTDSDLADLPEPEPPRPTRDQLLDAMVRYYEASKRMLDAIYAEGAQVVTVRRVAGESLSEMAAIADEIGVDLPPDLEVRALQMADAQRFLADAGNALQAEDAQRRAGLTTGEMRITPPKVNKPRSAASSAKARGAVPRPTGTPPDEWDTKQKK